MDAEATPVPSSAALPAGSPDGAALQEALEAQRRTIAGLQAELQLLRSVVDHLPYAVYWKDTDLVYRGCNRRFANDLGLASPGEIVGKTDADLPWQPGEAERFAEEERRILATGAGTYNDTETAIYPDGSQEWFETHKLPLVTPAGDSAGLLITYINITARKLAEATVRAQADLLQELSTPVIPVTDDVLVMPIIGSVDSARARGILETVLEEVVNRRASVVLLDITGVALIDSQVANALVQTAQAAQLLGARLILTGIRPEVAQAIIGLGVALPGMASFSTLQQGLAAVFGEIRLRDRRGAAGEAL